MSFTLTSPVTGAAQTGFTNPTYTLTLDQSPAYGRQWAVTGTGGTQTGVDTHSTSKPFTIAAFRPQIIKPAGAINPVTGVMTSFPRNTYKVIVRIGAQPAANQSPVAAVFALTMDVVAGAESYEPEQYKAALSLLIGAIDQQSAGLGDLLLTNIL